MSQALQELNFHYVRRIALQNMLGGISRCKLEALVGEGVIPKPYRLGKRTIAWRSDEIQSALEKIPRIEWGSVPTPAEEILPPLPKRGSPRKA